MKVAWCVLIVALWVAIAWPPPSRAHAEDGPTAVTKHVVLAQASPDEPLDPFLARKLFLEARALLDRDKPQSACELFEESQRLAPTLATLLNLGLCHRRAGRLVTAHDYFRQAEKMATLKGDAERGDEAHDAAAALAAERATLTLRISSADGTVLDVRIDDVPQPREVWERPMFIDAGEHRISVQKGSDRPWQGSVSVVDGSKHMVVIPELQPRSAHETPAPPSAPPPPPSPSIRAEPIAVGPAPLTDADPGLGTGRVVALSLGGAGIAALGASLFFTLTAKSQHDDAKDSCKQPDDVCRPEELEERASAIDKADVATVLVISGGAAVAGGLVLWILSAPETDRAKAVAPVSVRASPTAVMAEWRGTL
jgi:tetratricopeptide (TPR) repeat protein